MKGIKTVLIVSIILNCVLILGAIYFVIFGFDKVKSEPNDTINSESRGEILEDDMIDDVDDEGEESDETDNEAPVDNEICTDECNFDSFEYSFVASPVEYQPDSEGYTGYRVCDDGISSCTVYAIDSGFGGKTPSDSEYRIGFNAFECPSAAAGTKFCVVEGPVLIEKIF